MKLYSFGKLILKLSALFWFDVLNFCFCWHVEFFDALETNFFLLFSNMPRNILICHDNCYLS